jgi:uncharacterized protein
MLWGASLGELELRNEGGETRLRATFPYGRATVLMEGGRTGQARKEIIAPRAFAARIEAGEDIHFLSGHDFEKPLASRAAGTLTIRDTAAALTMEAVIVPELRAVSYVADFLAAFAAGLITGLSPGFRVPPDPGTETVEVQRDGSILRTVRAAQLFELSAVTRPAYPDAQIEARSWQATDTPCAVRSHPLNRWRH